MSGWPVIRWQPTGRARRLLVEDFRVEVDGVEYVIPAGFDDFDGASIPRWLWTTVGHPFMREYERAALVHDYLYGHPDARREHDIDDRRRVDALFFTMLRGDGVDPFMAKRMRWAVERFGASRFVDGVSFAVRTHEQLEALEREDCECAQDEIRAMIEAGEEDPELLASLREIEWGVIEKLF